MARSIALSNLNTYRHILFLLDLIIMKLVFDIFIDNLFTSYHSFTLSSSEFIRASRIFRLLAEANTLVSSAKILKLNLSEQLGKSLI